MCPPHTDGTYGTCVVCVFLSNYTNWHLHLQVTPEPIQGGHGGKRNSKVRKGRTGYVGSMWPLLGHVTDHSHVCLHLGSMSICILCKQAPWDHSLVMWPPLGLSAPVYTSVREGISTEEGLRSCYPSWGADCDDFFQRKSQLSLRLWSLVHHLHSGGWHHTPRKAWAAQTGFDELY